MSSKQKGEKEGLLGRPVSFGVFGGALRKRREGLGMTLDVLAAKTGISKPYLSNIETARAPGPPSEEKLRKIAEVLGLEPGEVVAGGDWLRTPESVRRAVREGAGALRRADGAIDLDAMMGVQGAASQGKGEGEIAVRAVPVINRVAAGKPAEFGDMEYPAGVADSYVPVADLPGAPVAAAFAVRVSGDSMWPEYGEGEILIVGPGEAADGDDCVVRLGEDVNFATTFKRVFFERDGEGEVTGVRLRAVNPKYAERRVSVEEVTGIYPLMYRMVPAKKGGERAREEGPGVETVRVTLEND